jgi:hypothetical protein
LVVSFCHYHIYEIGFNKYTKQAIYYMGIIKEYKLYKMQELESNELESDEAEGENPDLDILGDDGMEASVDDGMPDFDMSDLDDDEAASMGDEEIDGLDDNLDGESDLDMTDLEGEDSDELSDDEDMDMDDLDLDDEDLDFDMEDGETEGDENSEDSDFQGDIRSVTGACLIYKRVAEDSTYEELWVYNVGKDINTEVKIRRAILDGTDIKPQLGRSEDGQQTVKVWSLGNVQYLNIFGLPN